MEAFRRLAKRLVTSPVMTKEDRQVVKDILFTMSLDRASFEDLDQKWQGQIESEANVLYLQSVYRDKWQEKQFEYDEEESGILIDDVPAYGSSGKKITGKEVKAHLAVHPDLAVKRRELYMYTSLFKDIQSLVKFVFDRNQKLENVNVNYRREIKTDERT